MTKEFRKTVPLPPHQKGRYVDVASEVEPGVRHPEIGEGLRGSLTELCKTS